MRFAMHGSLIVFLSCGIFAQQATPPLVFEVASIKPSKEIDPRGGLLNPVGNRLTWTNADLGFMITFAYNVPGLQVVGGPNWLRSDKFDIVAKAEGDGKRTTDEFRQMFQNLLADRFKLSLHREMRDASVYVLNIGKNGPKNLEPKIEEKIGDNSYRLFRGGPRHLAALKMSMTSWRNYSSQTCEARFSTRPESRGNTRSSWTTIPWTAKSGCRPGFRKPEPPCILPFRNNSGSNWNPSNARWSTWSSITRRSRPGTSGLFILSLRPGRES
jgi:hypothetical protein